MITALDKLAKNPLVGRKPSLKTLEKYGLYDPKTHKVTIPTHLKPPEIDYSSIPEPVEQPVIQVVRTYDTNQVEKFDISKAEVNGKSIRDWIYTDLSSVAMKTMKVRGKQTLALYAKVPENLCKIRNVPYNDEENVFKYFNDPTVTIERTYQNPQWPAAGTRAKFLSGVLFLSENYPKLKGFISRDVLDTYDAEYKKLVNLSKAEQNIANANKIYYTWDVIKDEVLNHYGYKAGHASYEALLILLFNAVHGRDDFGAKLVYKPEDVKTGLEEDVNYLYLDRKARLCRLYMNSYKTSGSYKNQVITLDKKISDLIIKLHPDDTSTTLFPPSIGKDARKIGSFLIKTMKAIPLFEKEGINIKYLRHSIVSTALLHIRSDDPDKAKKLTDLAEKTFHSVKMQQDTYKSRLKDKEGNEIFIPKSIQKEYDHITTVMLGDDGTVEEGEEVTTKSNKKDVKPKAKRITKAKVKAKILKAIEEDAESGGDTEEIIKPKSIKKMSRKESLMDFAETSAKPPVNKQKDSLRRSARTRHPPKRL